MVTVTFKQVWGYANAHVPCNTCGRLSKRRIREYCTVNPFNKNEDGSVRNYSEVAAQARKLAIDEAERQVAAGRTCRVCEAKELSARNGGLGA